jgi:hypothetical protein
MLTYVETKNLDLIKLCHYYNAKKKKLINSMEINIESEYFPRCFGYITFDDRYILLDGSTIKILDTEDGKLIGYNIDLCSNYKSIYETRPQHFCLSPDKKAAALLEGDDVWIADTKTGKRRLLYTESRKGHRIYGVFWFPAENRIILNLTIEELINQNRTCFTEVLSVDPSTGTAKQISAPCPYYQYRNNETFMFICEVSSWVKPTSDWVDSVLGIR